MYAVIEQGSKQYKVAQGDVINIDLGGTEPDAQTIEFTKVMFINDGKKIKVGSPYLDGAKVTAKFDSTAEDSIVKGPKLYPAHFRRRKNSSRRVGHRQKYLQVTIDSIEG